MHWRGTSTPEVSWNIISKPQLKVAPESEPQYKASVTVPYIRGVTEAVKRILSEVDVQVFFRPHTTLKSLLVHPKDSIPAVQKANGFITSPVWDVPSCILVRQHDSWTCESRSTRQRWRRVRLLLQLWLSMSGKNIMEWHNHPCYRSQ